MWQREYLFTFGWNAEETGLADTNQTNPNQFYK